MGRRIIDKGTREELKRRGDWDAFLKYRDGLKARGVDVREANLRALDKFSVVGGGIAGVLAASGARVGAAALRGAGSGAGADEVDGKDVDGDVDEPLDPRLVDGLDGILSEFRDRTASEVEQFRWVARALGVRAVGGKGSVDVAGCPDPAAWALYTACLKIPGFESDFWRNVYPKIVPTRSQLEDKRGDVVDGGDLIAMCGKLLGLRERAESKEKDSA